jgi:hypothetical protein
MPKMPRKPGEKQKMPGDCLPAWLVTDFAGYSAPEVVSSPRRTQLELGFVERGTLRLKRLHRSAIIEIIPWNGSSEPEPKVSATPKEPSNPLKLANYYQSLLDSGQFENRAALARYLGVSRARVTHVLKRLNPAYQGSDA